MNTKYTAALIRAAVANGADSMTSLYRALTGNPKAKPSGSFAKAVIKECPDLKFASKPTTTQTPAAAKKTPAKKPAKKAKAAKKTTDTSADAPLCSDGNPNPFGGKKYWKIYAALVGKDLPYPEALQIASKVTGTPQHSIKHTLAVIRNIGQLSNAGRASCKFYEANKSKRILLKNHRDRKSVV